jgi:hypothetical protein
MSFTSLRVRATIVAVLSLVSLRLAENSATADTPALEISAPPSVDFGRAGTAVLTVASLLSSRSSDTSRYRSADVALSLGYFVVDRLSLSVGAHVSSAQGRHRVPDRLYFESSRIQGAIGLGRQLPLGGALSLWPRLDLTFGRTREATAQGETMDLMGQQFWVGGAVASLPLVIHPTRFVFMELGMQLRVSHDRGSRDTVTSQATLWPYFAAGLWL